MNTQGNNPIQKEIVIEEKLNGEWRVYEIVGESKYLEAIYFSKGEAEIAKKVLEEGGDLKTLIICKK